VVRGEEIAYANKRAAEVFGRAEAEDVSGTMLFEYLDSASRSRLRRARDRVLDGTGGSIDVEITVAKVDGSTVSMRASISAMEWDGQAVYRVTIRPHRSTD
jgi:PAS domain S-box-containing protein